MKKYITFLFSNNYSNFSTFFLDWIICFLSLVLFDIFSIVFAAIFSLLIILINYLTKCYNGFVRFTSIQEILKVILSQLISISIISIINFFYDLFEYEKLVLVFYIIISLKISFRLFIKVLYSKNLHNYKNRENTILYGAGKNGVLIKRAFYNNNFFNIIAFLDDNNLLQSRVIDGAKILPFDENLSSYIEKNNVKNIIFSTAKFTKSRKNHIVSFFKDLNIKIFDLSNHDKWIDNRPVLSSLAEFNIEELLFRDEIELNIEFLKSKYNNKTILVTGGAGSIGSEIVNQITKFNLNKLIIVDQSENAMFKLKQDLNEIHGDLKNFKFYVYDICNMDSIKTVFKEYDFDYVFHAAAYKHVPMLEYHPVTAVINNILGTKIITDLCYEFEVPKLLIVSSDKAVNPSNIMGASKRIAEIYSSKNFKNNSVTKVVTTRFGNVLGSSGSVVPIFKKQILNGGPVKVTHPEIIRYFMTIAEASLLVLESAVLGNKSEIFVFDMGKPVKILDLAINMIQLAGFQAGRDIEIKFTGLRPGEKLFEELLTSSEKLQKSHNEKIFIANKEIFNPDKFNQIEELINLALNNAKNDLIVEHMKKIIPEFKSLNSPYSKFD